MADTAIIFPVLIQVWLTLILFLRLGVVRVQATADRQVRVGDIALNADAWPDKPKKVANAVLNQFQLPVLFYLICVLLLITQGVDIVQLVFAWIFVLSRIVHATIHIGSNYVPHRFIAFLIGFSVLIGMWGYFSFAFVIKSF